MRYNCSAQLRGSTRKQKDGVDPGPYNFLVLEDRLSALSNYGQAVRRPVWSELLLFAAHVVAVARVGVESAHLVEKENAVKSEFYCEGRRRVCYALQAPVQGYTKDNFEQFFGTRMLEQRI